LDVPSTRATALWAAIGSLEDENARAGSPLQGKMDIGRFAVMGHSMGGGGTLETANGHSAGLRAAVPLAPWDTTSAFGMITTPTMIMAGQNDAVAPVAQHAMPFYGAIPATTTKAYVEFAGGDHYVADSPVSNTTAALLGLSWLKVHVEGDTRYGPFIKSQPAVSAFLTSH
jgi:predicted dienelactone hydrolase